MAVTFLFAFPLDLMSGGEILHCELHAATVLKKQNINTCTRSDEAPGAFESLIKRVDVSSGQFGTGTPNDL